MANDPTPTDIADLINSGVLVINDGYRAKNAELSDYGLPFARGGNVDGVFNFEGVDRFPEENLDKVGDKVSRPGDAVFTSKGTVGRFAFVTPDVPRFVYSPQLCFWRSLDYNVIEPRWLFYWMHGSEFLGQYSGVKGQTDMADYVSLRDQRRMHITLPSISRQRAIAEILGAIDDKIALNQRLSRVLEKQAHAIFKAWFVDFDPVKAKADGVKRFPGMPQEDFDQLSDQFVESNLGPLPQGWSEQSVADIAEYINGRAFTKHANAKGRMIVRIAELNSGPGGSTKYSDIETEPEYTVFPDDILFAWSGSLNVYRWHRDEAIINQHIFKVMPKDCPKWYVYYRLVEAMPFFQSIAATKATTMGHIKRGHLSDALFAAPPTWLLETATDQIRPLYDRVHCNERESLALANTRDTLLPKLISGELQVEGAEI